MKTPYEELAEWPKRGLEVVDHGDRITATDPVLGEMYSRPKAVLDLRANKVEAYRAAAVFAEQNAKAFAEWLLSGEDA